VARLKVGGVRRGEKKQSLRPLRNLKFSPKFGKKCRSSGGSAIALGLAEEIDLDHWFICPGGAQEEPTEGGERQSSDLPQIPVNRWIK
jgi:hypothetical protein